MNETQTSEVQNLLDNLYDDCLTHNSWDKEDEDNWFSMRESLERLAEILGLTIKGSEE